VIVTMVVVALRCHRASTLASVAHRVPWRRPLLPLRPLLRLVVATRWHPCARTRRSIRCGVMCDVLLVSCCGFLLWFLVVVSCCGFLLWFLVVAAVVSVVVGVT
jgi:hypothetical protein